jgi:hypothetical protein
MISEPVGIDAAGALGIDALEQRIDGLRVDVRRAATNGDRLAARRLRAELRRAEHDWEQAVGDLETGEIDAGETQAGAPGLPTVDTTPLLPIREQVHRALTLLSVPAAPKLVIAVHEAFFAGQIPATRLTSLRRDEERSYRAAPFARPYYVCGALSADLLASARGLLAVSTWPLEQRMIGPLTPRVDFLICAIRVCEQVVRIPTPGPAALRLLWRFAANIPGAADGFSGPDANLAGDGIRQAITGAQPAAIARAAHAELDVHRPADLAHRTAAAARARAQLGDLEQLFGSRLRSIPRTGTEP